MIWVLIAFIICVLAIVLILYSKRHNLQKEKYLYKKQDTLFTPAERSFLGVLNQAVEDNATIFGKVRVADVITPGKKKDWQKLFNKISSKHFDFIICDR